jgi:hypothetical protein
MSVGHERDRAFEVHQVRPVRRQGPDGQIRKDLLIQITQRRPGFLDEDQQRRENERYMKVGQTRAPATNPDFWYRGGATFLLDLDSFEVRYAIQKDVVKTNRLNRQREYLSGQRGTSLRELYFGQLRPGQRLAILHTGDE